MNCRNQIAAYHFLLDYCRSHTFLREAGAIKRDRQMPRIDSAQGVTVLGGRAAMKLLLCGLAHFFPSWKKEKRGWECYIMDPMDRRPRWDPVARIYTVPANVPESEANRFFKAKALLSLTAPRLVADEIREIPGVERTGLQQLHLLISDTEGLSVPGTSIIFRVKENWQNLHELVSCLPTLVLITELMCNEADILTQEKELARLQRKGRFDRLREKVGTPPETTGTEP